jgi:hypothetical protein
MFFRRRKPRVWSYQERVESLQQAGFDVSADRKRVARGECAALVRENARGTAEIVHTGIAIGGEIGAVVDAGNQKFLLTPSGVKLPALAAHLEALHAFEEDLRDGLGLVSLYNESLGTVNEQHLYDRVQGR